VRIGKINSKYCSQITEHKSTSFITGMWSSLNYENKVSFAKPSLKICIESFFFLFISFKDVWSLQTSHGQLKLWNKCRKIQEVIKSHSLCVSKLSQFDSDRKSRFFNCHRDARVADSIHLHAIMSLLRIFCAIFLLNDWRGSLFVFTLRNSTKYIFTATFALLFPQNCEN